MTATTEHDAINARYADTTTCECGALIEEIEQGGATYWAHVKRRRIHYGHAAVPARPTARG